MPLIDSHAHLDLNRYGDDRQSVIDRARAADLVHVVLIGQWATPTEPGIHGLDEARATLALARTDRGFFSATAGIHPHDAREPTQADWDALATLCAQPDLVAVGECGLDYHYDHSPRDQQRDAFVRQLALAKALHKPVVIHTREADAHTVELLREHLGPDGGVIHCFTSDPAAARSYLDLGLSISFSGVVTFKNAEQVREAARLVPLDRILIETDSPYLAPLPHRGKRNEPALVALTAQRLAEVKGLPVEEIARATTENARRALRLKP
ncbi:MAG: TatD family hydrolase [Deltaproteobacteria bacterium]|nr:TatD family hydrolase [Deltaproteobacteria bacterium]